MIEKLKSLCNKVNPDYTFDYQSLLIENKQTQDKNTGEKFLFLEEKKSGYYSGKFHLTKTTNLLLYVCTLVDIMQVDNALEREKVRKAMQEEFIVPFIKAFRESDIIAPDSQLTALPFENPLPMFDNYAVVEILSLRVAEILC